jgi:hypothetical protein
MREDRGGHLAVVVKQVAFRDAVVREQHPVAAAEMDAGLAQRRTSRLAYAARPTAAAVPIVRRLAVTHVRHALQHTVAIGACSPYFAAIVPSCPAAIGLMPEWYVSGDVGESDA